MGLLWGGVPPPTLDNHFQKFIFQICLFYIKLYIFTYLQKKPSKLIYTAITSRFYPTLIQICGSLTNFTEYLKSKTRFSNVKIV